MYSNPLRSSLISLGLLSLSVASCSDPGDDIGMTVAPTGSGSGAVAPVAPGQCVSEVGADGNLLLRATDATNYTFSNNLVLKKTAIAPKSDLTIDWSGLTKDLFKHDIVPGDIDLSVIVLWTLPHDKVIEDLNKDQLGKNGLIGALTHTVTATETTSLLTQMNVAYQDAPPPQEELWQYFDPVAAPPESHSYTVMANTGTDVKKGVRMLHYVYIDPASTNTMIKLENDSTVVNYTAELDTVPAVLVPASTGTITVDWNGMVNNAFGRPFENQTIDRVQILHFPFTAAELEGKFLDLDLIADQTYSGPVPSGNSIPMSTLTNSAGQPFAGVDPAIGGTWMVALMCSELVCANPAPWYLGRLEVCP